MSRQIDILLLLALPASGKSEVRRYLMSLTPEQCRKDFRMGPTAQLDDYPYVHMMRRVDQELRARGAESVFFISDDAPMREPYDWGTLIELLNEDFADMTAGRRAAPPSASRWLFERFDRARTRVGAKAIFSALDAKLRDGLAEALEAEAAELVKERGEAVPDSLEGKTIVMEFARGGPDGSKLPLPAPLGYRYSVAQLSDEILARASILYVWVTPEESRRKNTERSDPNQPGSILFHGVPMRVMLEDYGTDDMGWLIEHAERPDTVKIETRGKIYNLPVARFDNRKDLTTFVREDKSKWKPEDVAALHGGLAGAFERLAGAAAAAGGS